MAVARELPSEGAAAGDTPPPDRATAIRFLVLSGGILAVWCLHNGFLLPWEVQTIDAPVREPLLLLMRVAVWMLPALLFLRRHDPRPTLVALGVTSRPSWRGLGASAVIAVSYLLLVALLLRATTKPGQRPDAWATLLSLATLHTLLGAVLEEIFVRGFLLGQLVRFTSSARAQVTVVLVFGLVHLPAWLAFDGIDVGLLPSLVMVMVLGAVLGSVTRLSNGIWPAIIIHFANNMLASLLT